jgi:DNA-binding MarR family transcriptional regulator
MQRHDLSEIRNILSKIQTSLDSAETFDNEIHVDLRELEILVRRNRNRHFPAGYFSDPAWDILLDLDKAERENLSFHITNIGQDANIPLTTLLRYLATLEKDGLVTREADPTDRRKSLMRLSSKGRELLDKVFEDTVSGTMSSGKLSFPNFRVQ